MFFKNDFRNISSALFFWTFCHNNDHELEKESTGACEQSTRFLPEVRRLQRRLGAGGSGSVWRFNHHAWQVMATRSKPRLSLHRAGATLTGHCTIRHGWVHTHISTVVKLIHPQVFNIFTFFLFYLSLETFTKIIVSAFSITERVSTPVLGMLKPG